MIEDIEDEDGFFVDIDSDEEVSLDVINESDNTPKLVAKNIDDAFFVDIDNEEAQNEIVAELEDEEIKFSENYTDDKYIKDTYVGDEYFVDIDSDASAPDKSPGYIQEAEPEGLFANLWKGLFFVDRARAADAGALQTIFEQKAGFADGELNWDAISAEFMEGLRGEDHGTMSEYFKNKITQVSENPENYPYASKIIPALNTLLYVPNIVLEAMGNNVLPNPARDAALVMSVLLYPKNEDGTSAAPAPLLDMIKKVSNTYQATGETSLKKTMENMDSYATDKLALIAGFITDVVIDPVTYTTGIIKYVAKTGKYVIPDKVLTYMADKSGYTKAKIKAAFLSTNTGQSLSEASDQFWKMFSTRHGLTPEMYEAQLKFKNLVSAARQVSVRDNKELKARIEQYAKDTGVSYEDINKFIVEAVERGGIPNVNFKNLSKDSIEILSKSDDIRYEVWALATKNEAQLVAEIKGGISLKELGEQVLVNQADKGEMLLFYFNHAITPQARKLALKKKVTEFTHGYKMFGKEGKLKYWFDNKHSSLLKRKKQWEGLTINDINDLAKNGKLPGYDGIVFKEGFFYTDAPVAQALRDFKHHKSMAAVQLVDDITGVNGFGMSPDSIVLAAKEAGWKTKRKMDYDNVVPITEDALKYLKSSKHGDEALQNKWLGYEVTRNEFTRGYALPREIMDFVETSFKTINGPKEINKFLTHYDEMTRWFKSWTLSIFPSYHVRNKVGNMWNNHVMGVELKSYKDALKIQTNLANGTEGYIDIYVSGKRAKERISYTKFQELLDKHGVVGRGLFTADIETSLIQEMGKAKWLTLSADNKAIAIGKKVGENVENNARIANFLHHLRKGDTPADAAKQVQIALFDYADLTVFEQDVMKRIFPFYTWSRKNIPFQLQQMIKHPGKYKAVETLRRDLEAVIAPEDENEKYLSTWMLANYPAKVKIDSDGNPKYFMLGGWWAGADVWKLGSSPTKLVTDLLHPVLKVLYEQAGADEDGYITDTFSGQKLHPELNTDYMFGWDGNRMRVSQTTKHYLNNLRVLSTIDDFITSYYINQYPDKKRITMFGRKPTTIEESLLAFITGVRSFSVDLENQKLFATFDDANASDLYKKLVNEAMKNRAPDSEIEELMQKSVDSISGMSKGGVVSQMKRLHFAEGGIAEVKEEKPNWFRRKFNQVDSYLNNKLDNVSKSMHADEGFTKYMQHWLVDAPIEASKKLPFVDDETYEYKPVPDRLERKSKYDLQTDLANMGQDSETFRKNLLPSTRDLNKAIIEMATHPITTADALLNVTSGALANALPDNWADTIDSMGTSLGLSSSKPNQEMASAFGQMIVDEYGSLEKFRNTALSNPAQTILDMWAAGTLAKIGIKTAMNKVPKSVKDITPDMKEKFLATIQNMDLPIDKVLDKGVLGVSVAPKKSQIFPTPDGKPLGKKEVDEGMYIATELEKNKYFKDINSKQRSSLDGSYTKTPEALMKRFQNEIGGGVMSFAIEHSGDFLWRMTTPTGLSGSFEGDSVLFKSENVRNRLENNYGFHTEFLENIYNNISYGGNPAIGTKEFTKELNNAHDILIDYSVAHSKLPVYNAAQWVAREIPIEIAKRGSESLKPYIIKENFDARGNYIGPKPKADYSKAIRLLRTLENKIKAGDGDLNIWKNEAGQILKDKEGNPIEFNVDVTNSKLDSTMIEHNIDKLRTFINVDDIDNFILFGDDVGPMKENKLKRDAEEVPKEKAKPFDLEDLEQSMEKSTGLTTNKKEVDDFMDDLVLVKGEDGEFGLADKNVAKNVDEDGIYRGKVVGGSDILISPKWDSFLGQASKTDFTMGVVGIPEKFQNKKLGKRLYLKMMDELIKKGGERLSGDMMSSNAVRLWKSLIKTSDQELIDLGFPQLVGVLEVEAPAFELAIEEAKRDGYLTPMRSF